MKTSGGNYEKTKMINSELSYVISQMGHTDSLTIGDCGLPIPPQTKRIDLALTHNVPTFIQTLDVVLEELCVEEAIIASEIKEKNPEVYEAIKKRYIWDNMDGYKAINKLAHDIREK